MSASHPPTPDPSRSPGSPGSIGQAMYEKLCAHLFGELAADERRELEAELERSPELRAERDRLEATVGLVRAALPPEELSEEVQATLRAAAARGPLRVTETADARRARFRYLRGGGGLLAAAAAVVLLVGGVFLSRPLWREAMAPGGEEVARSSGPYTYGLFGEAPEAARDREAPREADLAGAARKDAGETSKALRALGYSGGEGGEAGAAPGIASDDEERLGMELRRNAPALREESEAAVAETITDSAVTVTAPAEEPAPVDGYSLRVGNEDAAKLAAPLERKAEETQQALGRYRGVTDTVAPSGPTTPGPAAPPASQGAAGKESRFAGRSGAARQRLAQTPNTAEQGSTMIPPRSAVTSGEEELDYDLGGWVEADPDPDEQEVLRRLAKLGYTADAGEKSANEERALGERAQEDQAAAGGRRLVLAPEEIEEVATDMLAGCRIQEGETPGAMFFRCWGANPFVLTAQDPLSTFSIDVDTASYTLARRMLNAGMFPQPDQIRTEEFVNYFLADQPAPPPGDVFAIGLEAAPSLFGSEPGMEMLRVTVRGKDVDAFDRQPLALTLVIDVSGSMKNDGRLELVKEAVLKLLDQLGTTDAVAVVAFNKEARLVSPMLSAGNRGPLADAIVQMSPDGGTNVEAGLKLGYELAAAGLTPHAVNRVVLFSDGVGNIGETDQERILAEVDGHRERGIYLNTFGVGIGNHNDVFLEQLADRGDGSYEYIDSAREAERALVQGFTKAMQPIARDVKIQVVFDPREVERYRLLGYENRAIADDRFRDDSVDAGEVNAGHQVTALYELVRTGVSTGTPFATVHVRYKPPFPVDRGDESARAKVEAEKAVEIERGIGVSDVQASFAGASQGYRRSVLVAQFAELLRQSVHARGDSLEALVDGTTRLEAEAGDPEVTELLGLVKRALPRLREIAARQPTELTALLDRLCELHFQQGQLELLAREGDEEANEPVKQELAAEIAKLEQQVRDLLAARYGAGADPNEQRLRALGYTDDGDR